MAQPDSSLGPLILALQSGVSHSAEEREAALGQLKSWENQPGYYPSLVELFANQELDLGAGRDMIRFQAVTAFKNGVAAHWRRGATHGIPDGEKDQIRPRLLGMVNEVHNKVAGSVALCLAQIARIDYGNTWQELPATLLSSIQFGLNQHAPQEQARLVLHRSLQFLHKIFKALASNRMQRGRLLSQTVCQAVFATVYRLYQTLLLTEINTLQTTGAPSVKPGQANDIEIIRLAFKCLAKMMLYGFADSSQDPVAKEFFQASVTNFQTVFTLRLSTLSNGLPAGPALGPMAQLTEHLAKYVKMYRAVLAQNAKMFIELGSTVEIVQTVWQVIESASADVSKIDGENVYALYPERFVVKSMMLLKECMGNWASSSPISIPPGFAVKYAELLVTRLMPLREVDLDRWNDDPEEWMTEEEAERWEFDLRPCAEHVMQSLVSGHVDEIGPVLVQLVQQASAISTEDGLLFKESVYCAFGKSSNLLRKFIGFDSWLSHTLVNEAASTDPAFAIIRRRIAWLVGDWIGELDDESPTARVQVYGLLSHLIGQNPSTDLAIRLTAARSLAKCCDAWHFKMEEFGPFLPAAIEAILALLREVDTAESQTRLSKTLNVVIDRAGAQVIPFAEPLMQTLGHLWSVATESQLRISIVVTFTALVSALNDQSQPLQAPGAAIIAQSVDLGSETHVYLLEDGLELWHALLKRSTALSGEMMGLLPVLVQHLAAGTDVLPRCLRILESYLLLNAPAVLEACCSDLFVVIENLLGDLKLEAVKAILHALDTILRTTPCQSWIGALDQTNAIGKLIFPIMQHEQIQIVTKYLGTLARIAVAGPTEFIQLVQSWAVRHNHSPDEVLTAIINEFIERVDYMSQGGQRKLVALALAYLLPTGHPVVLEHLQYYIPLWNSVMAQTEEDANGDAELYAIPDDYEDFIDYDTSETLETVRRQTLAAQDLTRTVRLATVIGAKVSEAQASQGGFDALRAKYFAELDSLILEELMQRLGGQLAG